MTEVKYTIYPDATVGIAIPPTPNLSYAELVNLVEQLRKIQREMAIVVAKQL